MTTMNEAKEAVLARFVANWADPADYVFDNERYDGDAEWLRVTVRNVTAQQETLGRVGNRRFMRYATVFIQVFTPIGTGTQRLDALATAARDIYEGVSFSGLRFTQAGVIRETGSDETWNRAIVELPFQYDETK